MRTLGDLDDATPECPFRVKLELNMYLSKQSRLAPRDIVWNGRLLATASLFVMLVSALPLGAAEIRQGQPEVVASKLCATLELSESLLGEAPTNERRFSRR